ncbi:hypothetical protein CI703_12070 [Shigella sonnei]|nr:hypothetical protein GP679_22330 [Escherichia coli]PBO91760.1 hypothetical protein CI703_12070 [Shigella sonnei]
MSSNIHGISCTANNYLKQAWNDIKNEYEKNQTYSITLFENTLGNDSNLLIVFYVQIMPDDFVMQLHRF